MTVFQLIIADKVPESSQAIPLVGIQHATVIVVVLPCNLDYCRTVAYSDYKYNKNKNSFETTKTAITVA